MGVSIAAKIKLMRIAYFLFLFKKSTFITPIFARKTIKTGISNIAPKQNNKRIDREKYSLTAGKASRKSLVYPIKKRKAGGKTMK